MSREDYFCSEGKPHYNYDVMYYYDSPFFTHKSKTIVVKNSGQSAYDIAVENGFNGTIEEWLASLKGTTPHIGENGNWFIGDVDTHVPASGGGSCPGMINDITEDDINSYFEGEVIIDGEPDTPLSQQDIDNYFDNSTEEPSEDSILTFKEIDRLFE